MNYVSSRFDDVVVGLFTVKKSQPRSFIIHHRDDGRLLLLLPPPPPASAATTTTTTTTRAGSQRHPGMKMLVGSGRRCMQWRKSRRAATTIGLTVRLPDDAVLEGRGRVGGSLLEALQGMDLNDVWEGGACGGACSCTTCRVVVETAPAPLPERSDDETDLLDTAAAAAARMERETDFLRPESRLSCQLELRPEDDGMVLELPEDVLNVLEVPLWLRGTR